jgi:enoyl-CoA hydratase/carnithine racemase
MTEPLVLVLGDGTVAQLILNRPGAYNALSPQLACELERALRAQAVDADAIIIRGAGGNF